MSNIYLGIDPGTTRIGYGVIRDDGTALIPLAWGIIENLGKDSVTEKQDTYRALTTLIKTWKPRAAGIEKLFFLNNKKSAMAVSEMRGVLILSLADQKIRIHEFTPLQVKQQVCGHGAAQKPQVQKMVRMLLRITKEIRPDDAADALALAICCATTTIAR